MKFLPLLLFPLAAAVMLQPPPAQQPARLYLAEEGHQWAWADCVGLTFEARQQALYVYAQNAHQEDIDDGSVGSVLAWLCNSFSSYPVLVGPVPVAGSEGRVFRVDLDNYGITRKSIERLAELGSGRVPVPEPYYHEAVIETVNEYWPGGKWTDGKTYAAGNYPVKKTVYAQAQGAPVEAGLLVSETGTQFPLLRFDWLLYYSLLEPRYHELLAGDTKLDTLKDFQRFAGEDDAESDREGDVVRGQVMQSEVTNHNRALERRSTRRRYGKGYSWRSIDFATSIRRDDLFADPLNDKAAANELIFSLRNGLQGYGVVDGKGARLDRAAIEVARDRRTPLQSPEVEVRNCATCHTRGLNMFADDVRASSPGAVRLDIDASKKDYYRRVRDRYYTTAIEPLLYQDQGSYDDAVRRVTAPWVEGGMAAEALAATVQRFLVDYERPLTLEGISRETGFPTVAIKGVIQRSRGSGLDSHIVAAELGRPVRRDQFEAGGFQSLCGLMVQIPRVKSD